MEKLILSRPGVTLVCPVALILLAVVQICHAQFNFASLYDFELTSDVIFPAPGDDVTLSCRRTEQYQRKLSNSFIAQDDGISWEFNDRPLLTTAVDDQGRCKVAKASGSRILGRTAFGQSRNLRLPNLTCSDDGTTIKLTIHNWRPRKLAGDAWRCLQFPFAESAKLDIQSFVPVLGVAIKQVIDNSGQYSQSRGTIVTCRSAACRPRASIDWFVLSADGDAVRLTSSPTLREQVDSNRDELSVTTSAILFSSDDDHGKQVYCTSSNMGDQAPVRSQNITVRVKYPPSVTVFAEPSSSVIEGSDVSLHCSATGRPVPKVTWVKKKSDADEAATGSDPTLVSLSATFDLVSARISDSGTYTCTATNGLEPNASASLVLFVREAAKAPPARPPADNGNTLKLGKESVSGGGSSSSGAAIAGGVIASLAVVALIVVIVFFVLKHRRKEERFLDRLSAQRSTDDSEGLGTYATCSTLPRPPLHQLPPYVEVLPPAGSDLKLSTVSNPGYGSSDIIIGGKLSSPSSQPGNRNRPLPNTPAGDHCDSEYAYIDESKVLNSQTPSHEPQNAYIKLQAVRTSSDGSNPPVVADGDGYEIPVSPREAPPVTQDFDAALYQRVPTRARTVFSPPSGSKHQQDTSHGKSYEDRQAPSFSRPEAAPRRGSHDMDRGRKHSDSNDFSFDTAF